MGPSPVRTGNTSACRWCVCGRVQGVGFRAFVVRVARALTLDGYVRNADDGTVDVWAEGPGESLDQLNEQLRKGPAHALVTEVARLSAIPTGTLKGFEVRG